MPTPLETSRTNLTVASASPVDDYVLVKRADLKALLQSEASANSALQLFTSHLTIATDPSNPNAGLTVSVLPGHSLNIKA